MVDDLSGNDMQSEPTGRFEGVIAIEAVSKAAQKFLQTEERLR